MMSRARPSYVRRVLLWLPPVVYAALIFHFSSESDPMPAVTAAVWDKALHAIEYGGFALLLCRAWRGEGRPWRVAFVLAVIVACTYALTDEWHQGTVPGRDSDMQDLMADSVGSSIGAAVYWLTGRRPWL
jgi:VanZ family protein